MEVIYVNYFVWKVYRRTVKKIFIYKIYYTNCFLIIGITFFFNSATVKSAAVCWKKCKIILVVVDILCG